MNHFPQVFHNFILSFPLFHILSTEFSTFFPHIVENFIFKFHFQFSRKEQ